MIYVISTILVVALIFTLVSIFDIKFWGKITNNHSKDLQTNKRQILLIFIGGLLLGLLFFLRKSIL